MADRLSLNSLLKEKLGSNNVYFQPPETIKLLYPAIIYNRSDINIRYADDKVYVNKIRYTVTLIDKNPDSTMVSKLLEIPLVSYDRQYVADGLNHDVFTIYF